MTLEIWVFQHTQGGIQLPNWIRGLKRKSPKFSVHGIKKVTLKKTNNLSNYFQFLVIHLHKTIYCVLSVHITRGDSPRKMTGGSPYLLRLKFVDWYRLGCYNIK